MTITIEQGGRYRARIKLGFFERMASNAQVAAKFTEAGFTNVSVLDGDGSSERWAFGTWPGETVTLEPSELDSHIADVQRIE